MRQTNSLLAWTGIHMSACKDEGAATVSYPSESRAHSLESQQVFLSHFNP
ncbi:BQ5605_C011g06632 [Microbotryum silenes-dioicae]|uniref:BQ5605_C011g06632 protein n=1 Tax=Microbotryum silenes-dioicae TaxID=796604 RepID=A0A2X0LTV1_9BASI|nr:BQ5605_C011g06632 [Microbotryum silenes-dioicae]